MPTATHRLCTTSDVPEGMIAEGHLPDGHRVAIYQVDGQFYVTDDRCTHGDSSLIDEGSIEGCIVECSWHFGAFDVTTGLPTASPCVAPLRTYRVELDGDDIHVEVPEVIRIVPVTTGPPGAAGGT